MKKTRILAALLAGLMLVSSLASCGTGENSADATGDDYIPTVTEDESALQDNLPDDLDFEGDEVTIISRYVEGWTSAEIGVEGLTSEPVNDAVFERNKAVEERLGVKIISIEDGTSGASAVVNKVAVAVKGGTNDYDAMAAPCYTTLPETLNGTFVNLRKTLYLDFDQPWWTQGFHDAVEYKGAQYAIIGSMLLSMYRFGFVTVFNKDMFEDAGQPMLYEYVENGTWTLDKQIELVPLFYEDNGDGIRDKKGDTYGFISSNYTSVDPYWSACDVDIITKDGDGEYQYTLDVERLHGVADKVLRLFYETGGGTMSFPFMENDAEQAQIRDYFVDGFAAMATLRVLEMENSSMRNMEQEYGVVPIPKYDQNQETHKTLLHDQFTVVCIPVTVQDEQLDQVSAVLEAMSSTSYRIVKPVYYEATLRTKLAQDPQSAEMMDIITDNVYIDAGVIYYSPLNGFHHTFRSVIKSGNNTTVSIFKMKDKATKRSLATIVSKLEKVAAKQDAD